MVSTSVDLDAPAVQSWLDFNRGKTVGCEDPLVPNWETNMSVTELNQPAGLFPTSSRRALQDELAMLLEEVPPELVDHVLEHNGVATPRCSPKMLKKALRIRDLTHELNR